MTYSLPLWQMHDYTARVSHSTADLVAQAPLGLRFVVTGARAAHDVAWVASSDLVDPTPFLESDQLLLSTGRQFADFGDADFAHYIARLQDAGVVGVGFGTEVLRDGVPDGLLAACVAADMTLIEVPLRTPFLALIRWVAAQVERVARRRDEWALEALRAIPAAALSGDVNAALAQLANRVEGSVILIDRSGQPAAPIGTSRPTELTLSATVAEAKGLLRVGRRGGRDLPVIEGTASLQTLGPGGHLAGVLVVLTADRLDRAARLVVNAVVALLEVSLFHEDRAESIRQRLGDHAVALAIEGHRQAVRALVDAAGGIMPEPPLLVTASAFATQHLLRAARTGLDDSDALIGAVDDVLVCISSQPSGHRRVNALAETGGRTGVVSEGAWENLGLSVDRARSALRRASEGSPVIRWDDGEPRILDALVAAPEAVSLARSALRAVLADAQGAELLQCARVWLGQGGQWDSSATILGLHRHSLKARIRRLGAILGLDLETFEGRVELHLLLAVR